MNKKLLEKNTTYILEKPKDGLKKNLTTFIFVPSKYPFPINESEQRAIDSLKEISDIVFIFQDRSNISMKKFSNLYRALGYVKSKTKSALYSQLYSLIYFKKVFLGSGFLMINIESLCSVDISQSYNLVVSQVSSSVFKYRRMTCEELQDIYMETGKNKVMSYFYELKNIDGLFSRLMISSSNNALFFRPNYIDFINDFLEEGNEDCPKNYLESFKDRDPGEFYASITEYLPDNVKVLNVHIEEARS